jgi:hypothetical protein
MLESMIALQGAGRQLEDPQVVWRGTWELKVMASTGRAQVGEEAIRVIGQGDGDWLGNVKVWISGAKQEFAMVALFCG